MSKTLTFNVTEIDVPDYNDSYSVFKYNGVVYNLRFTWNDNLGCWMFGIYNHLREPLMTGVKVVPNYCLNLFSGLNGFLDFVFVVKTDKDVVGREDFKNGTAKLLFSPVPKGES